MLSLKPLRTLQPLAPKARVVRRGESLLHHVPRLRETARALARGADPAEIERRLGLLRARLWASPYWLERLAASHASPDDLRSLEDLPHFPLLPRAELQARWSELPSFAPDTAGLAVVQSSGSSGDPVRVLKDSYDQVHMWGVLRFWLDRLGIALPPRPRVVLLCALPGGLEYSVRLPYFERGALHRLSTQRADPRAALAKAHPSVLFSDPGGLHWLAAQPDVPSSLQLVLTSAQHFGVAQRAQLAEVTRAPVLNYYSATEVGPMAWECLHAPGRFHVLHPDVHVESVAGELVVTRLRDSVLPLLRYLPGDRGTVESGACACGFEGDSIVGLDGRRACAFLLPDGAKVDAWQLAATFKQVPLRQFRLTQQGSNGFLLEVDADADVSLHGLGEAVDAALVRLGWTLPQVILRRERLDDGPMKPEPFVQAWQPR